MLHQAHQSQAQENNLGIRVDLLHQNLLITTNVAKMMMIDNEGKTSVEERVRARNAKEAEIKDERTTTLILPTGDEIGEF